MIEVKFFQSEDTSSYRLKLYSLSMGVCYKLKPTVTDWLECNPDPEWSYYHEIRWVNNQGVLTCIAGSVVVAFQNPRTATLFKLTWK